MRDSGTVHLEGAIIRLDNVVVIPEKLGVCFDGVDHGFSFQDIIRPLLLDPKEMMLSSPSILPVITKLRAVGVA